MRPIDPWVNPPKNPTAAIRKRATPKAGKVKRWHMPQEHRAARLEGYRIQLRRCGFTENQIAGVLARLLDQEVKDGE